MEGSVAVTGVRSFTFSILDSSAVEQWSSGAQNLAVTEGLYSVVLGATGMPAVPVTMLGKAGLKLHVTVSGQELTPDVDIVPAFQARSAWDFVNPLAGDVAGTQNQTLVIKLQGLPLDLTTTPPSTGQALVYNGSTWVAGTVAGTAGPVGPEGPMGPAGPSGPQGLPGAPGATGAAGPAGSSGADGRTILTGAGTPVATGAAGAIGDLYLDTINNQLYGPKAAATWVGLSGVALIGPQGATGPAGAQGASGATGASGPQGPVGPQGLLGPTGPQGVAGVPGQTIIAGQAVLNGTADPAVGVGADGDFYINTTTNVLWGPKAAGVWPVVGVSMIGPMGPQGLQGVAGAQGEQGLTGPQGDQGPVGPIGATGPQGPAGASGEQGLMGPQGLPGAVGATGPQGDQGPVGPIGATGPQGPAGATGDQGLPGAQGIQGIQGLQGLQGPQGASPFTLNGSAAVYTAGSVAVGAATPEASALMDLSSTTQGLLVPRMTLAQRDAIATPSLGLLIYQTDGTAGFYHHNGTAWSGPFGTSSSSGTVTSVSGDGGTTGLTLSGGPITGSGTLTLGGTLALGNGGTGAATATGARTSLGAAASGANGDITSLTGLSTALSLAQGGTGATTATGAANAILPSQTGNGGMFLTTNGTNPAWASFSSSQWTTSGSNVYYNAGNVGIGTTTPNNKLQIGSTTYSVNSLAMGNGTQNFAIDISARTIPTFFSDNNFSFMGSGGNGNVGIGTATPVSKLHIAGADMNNALLFENTSANPGRNFILFKTQGTEQGYIGLGGGATNHMSVAAYGASNNLFLETKGLVRMTINTDGNVGIGTSSPAYNLDVAGSLNATGITINGTPVASSTDTYWSTAGAGKIQYSGGQVGVGVATPAYSLDVAGDVNVTGAFRVNGAAFGGGTVTSVSGDGGTTGLTLSGGPITGSGTLTLGGTLALGNGGTGATTATGAANAILPSQTGNSGKVLTTDGSNPAWGSFSSSQWTTSGGNVYYNTGNVGIGTSTPTHPLQMGSGAHVTTAGVWTNASDSRLKTNVVNTNYGLQTVMQLRPVNYTMVKGGEAQVGFLAQEVQKIVPEVVSGTEGDMSQGETLGLSYGNLVPVLTKAIQDLKAENDALKASLSAEQQASARQQAKTEAQQTRILTLTNDLDTLKAQVAAILRQLVQDK